MPITGGSVTYGRTVQPAQYESKKAEVTITFAVEDGASDDAVEAIKTKAATMAQATALELVGMTAEAKPATAKRTTTKPAAEEPPKGDGKEAAAARMNAADKKKKAEAAKPKDEPKPEISKNPEDRKDPAQTTDPDDLYDDLLGEPEKPTGAKEYSDKDLTDTVSRVNGVIKDPGKIKAVRAKYTTGAIATIAKDKRAAFIAEIEALVPAK